MTEWGASRTAPNKRSTLLRKCKRTKDIALFLILPTLLLARVESRYLIPLNPILISQSTMSIYKEIADHRRLLCRCDADDNAGSRWILHAQQQSPTTPSITTCTLLQLEDFLQDGIRHDDPTQPPPVEYKLRADVMWTDARRPYRPWETVLGLAEYFPDETQAAWMTSTCRVLTHQIVLDKQEEGNYNNNNNKQLCHCPYPQPPWQKQEQQPTLSNGNDDSNLQEHLIDWIDASAIDSNHEEDSSLFFLPTPRSVVHFLRSLLGTDQAASPWVAAAAAADNKPHTPRTVILAVPPQQATPDSPLVRLRVSDACPSWVLHAVVPAFQSPPVPNTGDSEELSLAGCIPNTTNCMSSLLIYQRLPPRDSLQTLHPLTQQPVPVPDCLWQSYVPKKAPDDNDSDDEPPQVVHRLVAPPYLDAQVHYPDVLRILQDNLETIRDEAKHIAHWTAWPEQQHYQAVSDDDDDDDGGGGAPWNVFPLCYCFPASDISQRKWVPLTTAFVPLTTQILQSLGPVLCTALFSRLDPGARLEAHTGWADLANHVVRLHVPLEIPDGNLCGTWVDGCVMTHTAHGPWICFDDSKTHRAWNYSAATRTVLILDLARPAAWPMGTATGGHSEELDAFIQQMSTPR